MAIAALALILVCGSLAFFSARYWGAGSLTGQVAQSSSSSSIDIQAVISFLRLIAPSSCQVDADCQSVCGLSPENVCCAAACVSGQCSYNAHFLEAGKTCADPLGCECPGSACVVGPDKQLIGCCAVPDCTSGQCNLYTSGDCSELPIPDLNLSSSSSTSSASSSDPVSSISSVASSESSSSPVSSSSAEASSSLTVSSSSASVSSDVSSSVPVSSQSAGASSSSSVLSSSSASSASSSSASSSSSVMGGGPAIIVYGTCGDGRVNNPGEECDDGLYNADIPNRCRENCLIPRCSDGIVDRGEQCDDGNYDDGDACSNSCLRPYLVPPPYSPPPPPPWAVSSFGALIPSPSSSEVLHAAAGPFCGDSVVQADEYCDEGVFNADTPEARCRTDCSRPRCGDKVVHGAEECDDGNYVGDDGCTNECTLSVTQSATSSAAASAPAMVIARCGDSQVQSWRSEQCDDGNMIGGDGCSPLCEWETAQSSAQVVLQIPEQQFTSSLNMAYQSSSQPRAEPAAPPLYAGAPITPPPAQPGTGPGFVIFLASGAAAGIGAARKYLKRDAA